jgi:hypothetical protein
MKVRRTFRSGSGSLLWLSALVMCSGDVLSLEKRYDVDLLGTNGQQKKDDGRQQVPWRSVTLLCSYRLRLVIRLHGEQDFVVLAAYWSPYFCVPGG